MVGSSTPNTPCAETFTTTCTPTPSPNVDPEGYLTGVHGRFQSPGYPLPYADDTNLYVEILQPAGTHTTVTFLDMDIEESADCEFDMLHIEVRIFVLTLVCSTGY